MNNAIILDGLVTVTLVVCTVGGAKRGLLMSLSRLLGLVAGVFGGKIAVDAFAPAVSQRYVYPLVDEAVHSVLASTPDVKMVLDAKNALQSARELLTKVLEQLGLSTGSLSKIADDIAGELMAGSGDVTAVISRRLSEILVFVVAFLVIEAVVLFILRALDGVLRLPVIGFPNRVAGALLGLAKGMIIVVLLLWAGLTFLDSQTQNDEILAPATIEQTVISYRFVDWIERVLP